MKPSLQSSQARVGLSKLVQLSFSVHYHSSGIPGSHIKSSGHKTDTHHVIVSVSRPTMQSTM